MTIKQALKEKNKLTNLLLTKHIKFNKKIYTLFSALKKKKFKIGVATNAVKKTLDICLKNIRIKKFIDIKLSNEDIKNPKPHPEIYLRLLVLLDSKPTETLVLEDSAIGRTAVQESFCNLMAVNKLDDVNLNNILNLIKDLNKDKMKQINFSNVWSDDKLNVVIPMAGKGGRFVDAGYTFPKPLITVFGKNEASTKPLEVFPTIIVQCFIAER